LRADARTARAATPLVVAFALGGTQACQQHQSSYKAAREVIERHCLRCHSTHNAEPAFPIAPGGVVFDTAADMQRFAGRIRARAAIERTMPLLNKTGMREDDRELLRRWVERGAPASE
jgi:uncharacterized membrane protein